MSEPSQEGATTASEGRTSLLTIFLVFLRLGFTSFGGPVAHLGYFRDEFVGRRKWIEERAYADLVALCQFLPGPASSQVGIGVGLARGGLLGAFVAWTGFTMPSALALIAFAQIGVIVAGGLAGLLFLSAKAPTEHVPLGINVNRRLAVASLLLFFVGLIGLPVLATAYPSHTLALVESFYSSGSLVFGGGHVVLPLLQSEVVPPGWVSNDAFLAGYGAAQAVPGPLFTFAAYLGAVLEPVPNGLTGGLICLAAIFVPSFLLVVGALPFWDSLRRAKAMQTALLGINAAVVGLLLAALYDPVWTSAILSPSDFGLAIGAYTLLVFWKVPPWLVVILTAVGGWSLATLAAML